MSLAEFCRWLATTQGSIALHESQYMYPVIESIHVLTLCLFVGMAMMLDLRLLGIVMRRVPVSEVAFRILPWMTVGFVIMMMTGVLLFYGIPERSYHSIFFRVKLILLVLAGLNAWVFHAGVYRRVSAWNLAVVTPPAAKLAGVCSLVLWIAIVFAGRMIAYNWFDCDRPQSAIVVWAAGCEAQSEALVEATNR